MTSHIEPVAIPEEADEEKLYIDMIKQLAAKAPEPYGAIPPLIKKKRKQRKKKQAEEPVRRMSHVENWLAVDSRESIPDEEDLVHSPFRNFLSTDYLVLPLHMPPPSLSAAVHEQPNKKNKRSDLRPVLYPIPPAIDLDDDEEDEDDDEEYEEEDEEDEEEDEEGEDEEDKNLTNKHAIPSFSKSQKPSTSTTRSYAMSSSPPQVEEKSRWTETIAQLYKSLSLSNNNNNNNNSNNNNGTDNNNNSHNNNKKKPDFIPMPPPPKRSYRKRRSEATTQPRFNPDTNTYTRDTRSNPDHLRMISAELNMMKARKLSSPLKPRNFLPRRTDAFVRGEKRHRSHLNTEL